MMLSVVDIERDLIEPTFAIFQAILNNHDRPFDRFGQRQIAPSAGKEAVEACGWLHGPQVTDDHQLQQRTPAGSAWTFSA
jgi:hypothetical protein